VFYKIKIFFLSHHFAIFARTWLPENKNAVQLLNLDKGTEALTLWEINSHLIL
jgi:hypothetical protein